jgi:hypothetical protein
VFTPDFCSQVNIPGLMLRIMGGLLVIAIPERIFPE